MAFSGRPSFSPLSAKPLQTKFAAFLGTKTTGGVSRLGRDTWWFLHPSFCCANPVFQVTPAFFCVYGRWRYIYIYMWDHVLHHTPQVDCQYPPSNSGGRRHLGASPFYYGKIKHVWNHQPVLIIHRRSTAFGVANSKKQLEMSLKWSGCLPQNGGGVHPLPSGKLRLLWNIIIFNR